MTAPLLITFILLAFGPLSVWGAGKVLFHKESSAFAGAPNVTVLVASRVICSARCTAMDTVCCAGFTYHNNGTCHLFTHRETCVDPAWPLSADSFELWGSYRRQQCIDTCPEQCEFLENPESCTSFYLCEDDVPETNSCPTGLHFDSETKQCHYGENSQCTTTGLPTTEQPTTAEPTTVELTTAGPTAAEPASGNQCAVTSFVCPTGTAQFHFAKDDNCRQFYKCAHGCPTVFDCSAPLSYNPAIQNCDWDASTGCTDPPL